MRSSLNAALPVLAAAGVLVGVSLFALGCGGGSGDDGGGNGSPSPGASQSNAGVSPSPRVSVPPSNIVIASIEPNSGPMSGGTRVTIWGGGFQFRPPMRFHFDGGGTIHPLTDVEVISDTQARATVPPGTIPDGQPTEFTFLVGCDATDSCKNPGVRFTYTRE